LDEHAIEAVAQGSRTANVGANVVARDLVGGAEDLDAVPPVAGNEVAGPGSRPADGVLVAENVDAPEIGQGKVP
jgi:hypothetical protein